MGIFRSNLYSSRMNLKQPLSCTLLLLVALAVHAQPVVPAPVTFTIDPTRSSITLSGEVTIPLAGTYRFQPQGAGSLTTTYTGTIPVELAPPGIRFPGGGAVQANTNGSWQPTVGGGAGSAPADYGLMISPPLTTGYAAARNIRVDLTSPVISLTNGGFDASLLVLTYLTNSTLLPSMDYRVSSLLPGNSTNGTALLTGSVANSPGVAFLTNGAGLLTLVLPVNTTNVSTVGGDQATLVLQGQVVATAPASAWPVRVSISVQAGQLTLSWPSLAGQNYSVQTTGDLGIAWGSATGTMTTGPDTTTWTTSVDAGVGFYRVVGPL